MPVATNSTITCSNSTEGVWIDWNGDYASCSNAATANITVTYDCGAGTDEVIWVQWNSAAGTGNWTPVVEDPATVAERQEQHRQRMERVKQAEECADALLRSFLTPEQEQSWERDRHFDVMVEGGGRPARHYRIQRGVTGNIKRLEGGQIVESLCVHPTRVPTPDVNLAQLLHLLHDEDGLRRKANISRVA